MGVVNIREAQKLAEENKLDLVKISPNAKPPVCKIMDYGKHKYEQAKRDKESKKKQKTINIKEIRMTPNTEEHDLKVKAKKAIQFLSKGDRVKVSIRFRGRELGYTKLGRVVLEQFAELTSEVGVIDKRAKMEGRNMTMFLVPKNS